ncbi:M23 family metallopeptidase [Ezakiella peruensis]|uniref:M23 family metallopeptidase n=1 Tax=Ezakiella peruensis TaxID=1464038 RepID=UPI001FEA0135|nr:M23 family metallopeptidase [Ezakiella peruensis]
MSDEKFKRDIEDSSKYDRSKTEKSFDSQKKKAENFNENKDKKLDSMKQRVSSSGAEEQKNNSSQNNDYSFDKYQEQWIAKTKAEGVKNMTPLSFYDEEENSQPSYDEQNKENSESKTKESNEDKAEDQFSREKSSEAYKNKQSASWNEKEQRKFIEKNKLYGQKRAEYANKKDKAEREEYEADLKRPQFNRGSIAGERYLNRSKRIARTIEGKVAEEYANDEVSEEFNAKVKQIAGKTGRFTIMIPHNLNILSEPIEVFVRNKEDGKIYALNESMRWSHLGYALKTSPFLAANYALNKTEDKFKELTAPEIKKDEVYQEVVNTAETVAKYGENKFRQRNAIKKRNKNQEKQYFEFKKQHFEEKKYINQMMSENPVADKASKAKLKKKYKKEFNQKAKNNFFKRMKNSMKKKTLARKIYYRKIRNATLLICGLILILILLLSSALSCLGSSGQTEFSAYKTDDSTVSEVEDEYSLSTIILYENWASGVVKENPDADEFIFEADPAGHNIMQMQTYFSAINNGEYYDSAEGKRLAADLFASQYVIKTNRIIEKRYKQEIKINPDGSASYVQVPYDYIIIEAYLYNNYFSQGEEFYTSKLNDDQKFIYENIKFGLGSLAMLAQPGDIEFEDSIVWEYGWHGPPPTFSDYATISTGKNVYSPFDCYVKEASGGEIKFEHTVNDGPTYEIEYSGLGTVSVNSGEHVTKKQVVGQANNINVRITKKDENGSVTLNPYFLYSRTSQNISAFSKNASSKNLNNYVYKGSNVEKLEPVDGEFEWPLPGHYKISSKFGYRINPIYGNQEGHLGTDIPAPNGTEIKAAKDGKVIYSGWINSYGYIVVIDHGKYQTAYAHCSSLIARVGQEVKAGDVISLVGSTGDSTGNHLHFEVRIGKQRFDPMLWFKTK